VRSSRSLSTSAQPHVHGVGGSIKEEGRDTGPVLSGRDGLLPSARESRDGAIEGSCSQSGNTTPGKGNNGPPGGAPSGRRTASQVAARLTTAPHTASLNENNVSPRLVNHPSVSLSRADTPASRRAALFSSVSPPKENAAAAIAAAGRTSTVTDIRRGALGNVGANSSDEEDDIDDLRHLLRPARVSSATPFTPVNSSSSTTSGIAPPLPGSVPGPQPQTTTTLLPSIPSKDALEGEQLDQLGPLPQQPHPATTPLSPKPSKSPKSQQSPPPASASGTPFSPRRSTILEETPPPPQGQEQPVAPEDLLPPITNFLDFVVVEVGEPGIASLFERPDPQGSKTDLNNLSLYDIFVKAARFGEADLKRDTSDLHNRVHAMEVELRQVRTQLPVAMQNGKEPEPLFLKKMAHVASQVGETKRLQEVLNKAKQEVVEAKKYLKDAKPREYPEFFGLFKQLMKDLKDSLGTIQKWKDNQMRMAARRQSVAQRQSMLQLQRRTTTTGSASSLGPQPPPR